MSIDKVIKFFLYAIFLIFIQVLFDNYAHFPFKVRANVFILLIILFPYSYNRLSLLIISFLYGLFYDFLQNTVALNAASIALVAFLRPYILEFIKTYTRIDLTKDINAFNWGIMSMFFYSMFFSFVYFFSYNFFDVMSLKKILLVFLSSLISSIISALFMVLINLIIVKNS